MGVLDFRDGWRERFPSLKRRLSFLLRGLLGLLFVVSGLGKVSNLVAFHRELVLYAFLPAWSLPVLAVAIPAVEYFLGACLVLGMWLRRVVPILAGLLVVFSGALVYRMAAGATGSCGCFGGMGN